MEIELKAKAIEKLVDYTASGIGSIAGPMLAPWQAKREGKAKLIRAKADSEILRLQAQAQSEARKLAIEPNADVSGTVRISNYMEQSLNYQTSKRIANVKSVVEKTAELIQDKEVPSDEPNHDWTARFFGSVQDISSQELHVLWSKILSGEIEQPGSTSILSLEILKILNQQQLGFSNYFVRCAYFRFPHRKHLAMHAFPLWEVVQAQMH